MNIQHIHFLLKKIYNRFNEINPNPQIELNYNNDFTLLVAVLLSAQSTDKMVNKVTANIFHKYNSAEHFSQLSISQIEEMIKQIGLFRSKARNIYLLSITLRHQKIPNTLEELIKLPGVGVKTASVFLAATNQKNLIAVDTHVFRVINRVGFLKSENFDAVYKILNNLIPDKLKYKCHHWLVLHGRYICKSIKPQCEKCLINKFCKYYKKNYNA